VTVEFFLVVPLLIMVLAAGIQVISVARTRIELLGAVRDGARVAATTPDPAKAVEAVRNALAPVDRDRVRVSVSRPSVVGRPAKASPLLVAYWNTGPKQLPRASARSSCFALFFM